MTAIPARLSAPGPGWTTYADVVVVGSGIAGLTAALRVRASGAGSVLVVTKDRLSSGSTQWAQGGIAAALGPEDTPEQHLHDTLIAGAGICDVDAVRVLVNEGPAAVHELIDLGTHFDQTSEGGLQLTREGGHLRDRIAHAGGDATGAEIQRGAVAAGPAPRGARGVQDAPGAEIQRALVAAVRSARGIEVIEHALAVDVIPGAEGGVAGVTVHVMG